MSWTHDLLASLKRLVGPSERPADTVTAEAPSPAKATTQPPVEETLEESPLATVAPEPEPLTFATVEPETVESETVVPEPELASFEPEPPAPVASPEPRTSAAPGSLTIRLESERGPVSVFEVSRSGATIGRAPESTIRLDDLSVSRRHARIAWKQGAYWLSDVGSMGGTWVDGTKLNAPRRIAEGQRIDIGVCRLTVAAAPQLPVSSGSSSHSGNGSGSRRSGGA